MSKRIRISDSGNSEEQGLREAVLYEKVGDGAVRCNICQRRCFIAIGERGFCAGRINQDGVLFVLNYGRTALVTRAPIEIKPMYHFHPGSHALSFGTLGCNFRCKHCQNWDIAHAIIGENGSDTQYLSPEHAVSLAEKYDCQGLSWTYNEPTVWFEYTLDSARLAKQRGLYTNYVTNGFMTPEALDTIGPYLDSFRVDVKGFTEGFYREIANVPSFREILETASRAGKKWGMHVEVVTNVIPGYNDDESLTSLAGWIRDSLGEDTPWHVTRFVPHLEFSHLSQTPVSTLERIHEEGRRQGLRFVYLGNVPGHPKENTYCPACGKLLIERTAHAVLQHYIERGSCKHCGEIIPLVGVPRISSTPRELLTSLL